MAQPNWLHGVAAALLLAGCPRDASEDRPKPATVAPTAITSASASTSASTSAAAAGTSPLIAEPFASAETLGPWQRAVGAGTADGLASEVVWDEGAVRMSGTKATQSWTALTRTVDVRGARWLIMRARIRTEAVD